MEYDSLIGKMVYSKAGRDKGKAFIVVNLLDDRYVYISDGQYRPIEKPKKKKIKHLVFTNILAKDVKNLILLGQQVNNLYIKKFLQSNDANKEV